MDKMTSYERIKRMYEHREADRVPITDSPWEGTLARWRKEGLPADQTWQEHFGVDNIVSIGVDISPRYEQKIVEETETSVTRTTAWGVTLKYNKEMDSTPEYMGFTVTDPDSWRKAKARMTPTRDRINWARLEKEYKGWRESGAWIEAGFWFGFDVTHSWFVGTETLLMAMVEEPEWCAEMFNHYLDMDLALFDMVWDAGYTFDTIFWPDDMGYKQNQFFSLKTYRELLKPVQKRAAEWAHQKGVKVHLHSCGDIRPLVPELIEIGIDCLNPLEVKAGMDPALLKKQYGDRMVFHGGLNAVLWDDPDAVEAEMRRLIPIMKEQGGYIFSSDHSIPNSVTYDTMKRVVSLAKDLGRY